MACQEFEERLLDYAALSSVERDAVEAHLAGCPACREFVEALRQVDGELSAAFSGLHLDRAVTSKVTRALRPPSRIPDVLDLAGWVALAAIAVGLLLWWLPQTNLRISPAMAAAGLVFVAALVLTGSFYFAED